jgi:hypothetical protein
VSLEGGDQDLRPAKFTGVRPFGVAVGDEATDRVFDDHGAVEETREPAG